MLHDSLGVALDDERIKYASKAGEENIPLDWALGAFILNTAAPTYDNSGESGPRVAGLPLHSVVADALREGQWWIASSRSRNPIIQLLRACIPPSSAVNLHSDAPEDRYLWKIGDAAPSNSFSIATIWDHLHPVGVRVDWFESVWFKGRIPKHDFISWLNSRDRLLTRDRLVSWGLLVPSTCLFCNTYDESRQHLFFDCSYSKEVWYYFTSKTHLSPPLNFEDGVRWLKNPCRDKNVAWILRLAYQASVYSIWKECNTRIHTASSRPASAVLMETKTMLRSHLGPLTLKQRVSNPSDTLLVTWFRVFQ
ncbi:PREDICTED: uncharacterized protein LOC109128645 [Camelina sativa]|uniref:Uncharacterized protein LOC109128645 n=1 Tax=Camelina sativa TaxID=90675 RepID=A0ABM1QW54_CAMSA|nr:PREDICTED: uncharacterized protein LOC109128645 [Camelina sativa]